MSRKTDFMTFDEYVGQIQKHHGWRVSAWEREQQAIELVRKHGGNAFAEYDGFDDERAPRPSDAHIPKSPDVESVAPYSRITLMSDGEFHGHSYWCPSLMIVISVSGAEIEGYIDRKSWANAGRRTVRKEQIIECLPPFLPGEIDSEGQDDDLPF